MQQECWRDNKEEDGDGLPGWRNSLREPPEEHEYVEKAPVTPAAPHGRTERRRFKGMFGGTLGGTIDPRNRYTALAPNKKHV